MIPIHFFRQRMLKGCIFVGAFVSLLRPSAASPSANDIIKMMDQAMTRARDQLFVYEVTTEEAGKAARRLSMRVQIKGDKLRFVDFLAPGDIKGMKVLIVSLDQMYIYLPAYRKIRRVASHARSQSFMGTAFNQDDMSITRYGDLYAGALIKETSGEWLIRATRRPGKTFPYAALEFSIRKDIHHPSKIEYMSDSGIKLKTETRSDYTCKDNVCNPREMVMVDHSRGHIRTKLLRTEWKFNSGIPDEVFTPRYLQRP